MLNEEDFKEVFERMAVVVDGQNASDLLYQNIGGHFQMSAAY